MTAKAKNRWDLAISLATARRPRLEVCVKTRNPSPLFSNYPEIFQEFPTLCKQYANKLLLGRNKWTF